jgi:cap1 methyltransferase
VVADGGFDAQRESECQEQLSQKLVICEFAAGLELLSEGGTMLVKLFGCQTECIRRAMRFMYAHFERIQEIKPVSSRPASQERYAVFWGFRGLPSTWTGGPSWMSSIFIGKGFGAEQDENPCLEFDDYLDKIDRDMMRLNLKACFDILTNLERRTAASKESSDIMGFGHQKRMDNQAQQQMRLYRQAWRLHAL